MLCLYPRRIITNNSKSPTAVVAMQIRAAQQTLLAIPDLIVVTGYHGDAVGNLDVPFNIVDMSLMFDFATTFPNAYLMIFNAEFDPTGVPPNLAHRTEVSNDPFCGQNHIFDYFQRGCVFFTWCNSDTRVRAVLGQGALGPGEVLG